MQSQKGIWVALIAVAIIAVASLFIVLTKGAPSSSVSFGGVTNYSEVDAAALRIGAGCDNGVNSDCAGSRAGGLYFGRGILIASNYTSVAASTTFAGDVAVPGVVSGDTVDAWFATSTAVGAGWQIVGSSASTTAGFITVRWINDTGAAATVPASIASSTNYLVLHPLTKTPGL